MVSLLNKIRSSNDLILNESDLKWYRGLVEIQDAITQSTHFFFQEHGCKTLHLPITTLSISSPLGRGSDSLPVQIDYLGKKTYLADSMQFMLEYGCRLHNETTRGCYYLMPSFRDEKNDKTHLSQFYHSEVEIKGTLNEAIHIATDYLRTMTLSIMNQCEDFIRYSVGDVSHIETFLNSNDSIPQVTFDTAAKILNNNSSFIKDHGDFRTITHQGELQLIDYYNGMIWLTHHDHLAVPFYQAFDDAAFKQAKNADLLFGVGEVIGLGMRHLTSQDVCKALQIHNVDPKPYSWYYLLRDVYPMQTSGFGIGTERFICWILKRNNIHECNLISLIDT